MGTIEKYWKTIPNVQASAKSATYIAMSELAAAEGEDPDCPGRQVDDPLTDDVAEGAAGAAVLTPLEIGHQFLRANANKPGKSS